LSSASLQSPAHAHTASSSPSHGPSPIEGSGGG
jgi:hypothetical protein